MSARRGGAPLHWMLGAAALVLALDLPLKLWVETHLPEGERVRLVGGVFAITHARNPGAAFGLFDAAAPEWRVAGFALVSLIALAVIASFFRRLAPGDQRNAVALGLILGGMTSNLFDRLWRGEVVDYLHWRIWTGYVWPDFNLADVAIVLGVAALILELLVGEVAARVAPPVDDS